MSQHPLYQQLILEHSRHPQNFGALPAPTVEAEEFNPVCGDRVSLQIALSNDIISDIKFQGEGCAISQASASLMTTRLKGQPLAEAESLMALFRAMLVDSNKHDTQDLRELAALSQVRRYPVRIKCVLMPWDAFRTAIERI